VAVGIIQANHSGQENTSQVGYLVSCLPAAQYEHPYQNCSYWTTLLFLIYCKSPYFINRPKHLCNILESLVSIIYIKINK